MFKLFILAKTNTEKVYLVHNSFLQQLINEKKIKQILRSIGWTDVQNDQRKNNNNFSGIEKRLQYQKCLYQQALSIREQLNKGHKLEIILGYCSQIKQIISQVKQVSKTPLSVLIGGETGTGKGVLATVIHMLSERKDKPFVAVDCGAIPESLIESELFGHEKGSFTGAHKRTLGKFQMANKGTIFLDEIGNLPKDLQAKLLRCLEDKIIYPIGSTTPVKLDIRIIGASNSNLFQEVKSSNFREDLYYRLNEFEFKLPCLRDRSEDIFFFIEKFLLEANNEFGKNVIGFSKEATDFFLEYSWPGNIREMKNLIKRGVLLADNVICMEHFPENIYDLQLPKSLDSFLEKALLQGYSMNDIIQGIKEEAEKRIIIKALHATHGKKTDVSKMLQIDYSTIYRKLKKYDISGSSVLTLF